jgi:hypothetical protein
VTASTGVVVSGWTCNVTTSSSGVFSLALDVANDRLFVGGYGFTSIGGASKTRLALVTASTGVVVSGWTCNVTNSVKALALDVANDRLFVGGDFNGAASFDGVTRDRFGTTIASTGVTP